MPKAILTNGIFPYIISEDLLLFGMKFTVSPNSIRFARLSPKRAVKFIIAAFIEIDKGHRFAMAFV